MMSSHSHLEAGLSCLYLYEDEHDALPPMNHKHEVYNGDYTHGGGTSTKTTTTTTHPRLYSTRQWLCETKRPSAANLNPPASPTASPATRTFDEHNPFPAHDHTPHLPRHWKFTTYANTRKTGGKKTLKTGTLDQKGPKRNGTVRENKIGEPPVRALWAEDRILSSSDTPYARFEFATNAIPTLPMPTQTCPSANPDATGDFPFLVLPSPKKKGGNEINTDTRPNALLTCQFAVS